MRALDATVQQALLKLPDLLSHNVQRASRPAVADGRRGDPGTLPGHMVAKGTHREREVKRPTTTCDCGIYCQDKGDACRYTARPQDKPEHGTTGFCGAA
jgi:hypothetical protein